MDPVRNPYVPGAGVQPPELAGREELQSAVAITLARIRAGRSAKSMLAPQLRTGLLKLSRVEKAKDSAQRALRGLAGFAKALEFTFDDIEVGFSFGIEPEQGLADNGDLEIDFSDLFALVGTAAKAANTVVVLFIDEMQTSKWKNCLP